MYQHPGQGPHPGYQPAYQPGFQPVAYHPGDPPGIQAGFPPQPRSEFGSKASLGNLADEKPKKRKKPKAEDVGTRINECLGVLVFLTVTILQAVEMGVDVWLLVIYGIEGKMTLLGVSVLLLALTALFSAFYYSLQMKKEGVKESFSLACRLLTNFPLQLGIIGERLIHLNRRADACCGPDPDRLKKDWVFAKLKLGQSIFQSLPFCVMTTYSLLAYRHHHVAQYVVIAVSFLSLVFSAAVHEVIRKERLRKVTVGVVESFVVFLYHAFILLSRALALSVFAYFYQQWVLAIVIPHIMLWFSYLYGVYRDVFKVDVWKIIMHAFYNLAAYFPVNNEYRPMGEIIGFFILFMGENILMICLPVTVPFSLVVNKAHYPGSTFYTVATVLILAGAVIGLFLMFVFYFVCHKSRGDIYRAHFKCLPQGCPCCAEDDEIEVDDGRERPPPEGRRIYRGQQGHQGQTDAMLMSSTPQPPVNNNQQSPTGQNKFTFDETAPPSYRSRPHSYDDGLDRSSGDGDSDTKDALPDDEQAVFMEDGDAGDGHMYAQVAPRPAPRRFVKKDHRLPDRY